MLKRISILFAPSLLFSPLILDANGIEQMAMAFHGGTGYTLKQVTGKPTDEEMPS